MTGLGKTAAEVRVHVDVDAQVNLVLSPTATEEITVLAQTEAVDLKKTEVNFNYTADNTKNLPLGRSYSGLFQLIPGVAQNNSYRSRRGRQPPGQRVPDGRRQHLEPRLRLPRDRGERAGHRRVQRQARRDQRGVRPRGGHRDERGEQVGHEHLLRQRPHPVPAGVLHERSRRPGVRRAAHGRLQPGDRARRADRQGQGVLLRLGPVPEDDPGRPREQVRHAAARPRQLHAGVLRQDHVHPDPEAPDRGELPLPADRLRGQQRRLRLFADRGHHGRGPGPHRDRGLVVLRDQPHHLRPEVPLHEGRQQLQPRHPPRLPAHLGQQQHRPRWASTPTRTRRTSTSAATSTRTARTTGATRSRARSASTSTSGARATSSRPASATRSARRTSTVSPTAGARSRGSPPPCPTTGPATTSSSPRRSARAAPGRSSSRTR